MDLSNFEPAHREQTNIMVMLSGPSNSGKTLSALRMARGVAEYMMEVLGRESVLVAVIDTERKRSAYYWGHKALGGRTPDGQPVFQFYIKEIADNFDPRNYVNAITIARRQGVDILIIDSLTHAWAAQGGMLQMHDKIAKKQKNSYTAWQPVDREYNSLLDAVLQYPGHVFVTVRSKEAHEMQPEPDGKGNVKLVPKKIGLKPIFREGTRGSLTYEFPVAFRIDQEGHRAEIDKDITQVFDSEEKPWEPQKLTELHGRELAEWLHDIGPGAAPELPGELEEENAAAPSGTKPAKKKKPRDAKFQPVKEDDAKAAATAPPEKDEPDVRPSRGRRNAVKNAKRHSRDMAEDDLFGD